jgi:hypothetical protein
MFMTTFPRSPRLIRGGIVLIDPSSGLVQRIIALQYNPDTLTRTLQVQGAGEAGGDRLEALRLKGPPVETLKLDAEIDAADLLERGDATVATLGIHPTLAALETLVYPTSAAVQAAEGQSSAGSIEIAPAEAPLPLFIWSSTRILPVRITEFSITEEAFDPALNPIRAKISLGMRVLTVNDLGLSHRGGNLFMIYFQQKERLALRAQPGTFSTLGIGGL